MHALMQTCYSMDVFVLLATASKTYIRSILFRTLAYTGAKQASRVPLLLLLLHKFGHGWHTSHMRVVLYAAIKEIEVF